MTSIVLACVVAALVSALPGYFISFRFNSSNYAATNKSGDFGTPRGGFFAIMSGMLIGLLAVRIASEFGLPSEVAGPAFITAMIAGAAGGVFGMFRGQAARKADKK